MQNTARLAGYRQRSMMASRQRGTLRLILLRRFKHEPWYQKTGGVLAAEYLRLVWQTSRFVMEPADPYQLYDKEQPVILAMWHGQHFMLPFFRRGYRIKVLISRHSDGEINAIAAERLGVGTVRGSGDHGGRFHIKGGVSAFRAMAELLAEGWNMALTADVPKVSRVAGLGIIKLASESGRPIFPVSLATSRRIVLNNWDRSEVNLPFSRGTRTGSCAAGRRRGHNRAGAQRARESPQYRCRTRTRHRRPPYRAHQRRAATGEARERSLRLAAGYRIMAGSAIDAQNRRRQ